MMRFALTAFWAMVLLMMAVPGKARQTDTSGIAQVVTKFVKAMEDSDIPALSKLTASGLSYGHSSGKVEDKTAFLESFRSGASDFVKISITEQHIRVFNGTAVVRHLLEADTNDNHKPGHVRLKILTVWQQIDGEWILIARQAVKPV